MKKSYVKVHYNRLSLFGVNIPFYHTFLEINLKGKKKSIGFYGPKGKTLPYLLSTIFYVGGKTFSEPKLSIKGPILTTNPKKVKKLLSVLPDHEWTRYHALPNNCFHWRNEVLREAGISLSNDRWWRRAS